MSPFKHQQEILEKYKEANALAHKCYDDCIKQGALIFLTGTLTGPYTEHKTHWMTNGEVIELVEASSLHWVPLDFNWMY